MEPMRWPELVEGACPELVEGLKRFAFSALLVAGLLVLMAGAALAQDQKIHVEPEAVGPGGTVAVIGEGFEANSTVKITLHGHAGALKVARTDATGAFTADVLIPADMPDGVHMLMARDETGEMAQFRLTVDAAAVNTPSRATLAYIVGGASLLVLLAGIGGVIVTRKPQQIATARRPEPNRLS